MYAPPAAHPHSSAPWPPQAAPARAPVIPHWSQPPVPRQSSSSASYAPAPPATASAYAAQHQQQQQAAQYQAAYPGSSGSQPAPPPVPQGVNPQAWMQGRWRFQPQAAAQAPSAAAAYAHQGPYAMGWTVHAGWGVNPAAAYYPPQKPRDPSYWNTVLSDNGLKLENMHIRQEQQPAREGRAPQAHTPWTWVPRELDADPSPPAQTRDPDPPPVPPANARTNSNSASSSSSVPRRHNTEPALMSAAANPTPSPYVPGAAAPAGRALTRHHTEPVAAPTPQRAGTVPEGFSEVKALRTTFSPAIIRTPTHYRHASSSQTVAVSANRQASERIPPLRVYPEPTPSASSNSSSSTSSTVTVRPGTATSRPMQRAHTMPGSLSVSAALQLRDLPDADGVEGTLSPLLEVGPMPPADGRQEAGRYGIYAPAMERGREGREGRVPSRSPTYPFPPNGNVNGQSPHHHGSAQPSPNYGQSTQPSPHHARQASANPSPHHARQASAHPSRQASANPSPHYAVQQQQYYATPDSSPASDPPDSDSGSESDDESEDGAGAWVRPQTPYRRERGQVGSPEPIAREPEPHARERDREEPDPRARERDRERERERARADETVRDRERAHRERERERERERDRKREYEREQHRAHRRERERERERERREQRYSSSGSSAHTGRSNASANPLPVPPRDVYDAAYRTQAQAYARAPGPSGSSTPYSSHSGESYRSRGYEPSPRAADAYGAQAPVDAYGAQAQADAYAARAQVDVYAARAQSHARGTGQRGR